MPFQNQKCIISTSKELFKEVITSIPVVPEYAEISFLADGIKLPKRDDAADESRYVKECFNNEVMPYPNMALPYNEHIGTFIPDFGRRDFISFSKSDSALKTIASIEGMLSGGRIHTINITTKRLDLAEFAYQHLKQSFMRCLSDRDYVPDEGELWLSSELKKGYDSGHRPLTTINFNSSSGVKLDLYEQDNKLENVFAWFSQLAGKYRA